MVCGGLRYFNGPPAPWGAWLQMTGDLCFPYKFLMSLCQTIENQTVSKLGQNEP